MRIYNFLVYVPKNLIPVVTLLDSYFHPVCVLIRAQEILSPHVPHRYWDMYENILS